MLSNEETTMLNNVD